MKLPNHKPCPMCGCDDLRLFDRGLECRTCGLWFGYGSIARGRGNTLTEAWNNRSKEGQQTRKNRPAIGSKAGKG